MSTLDTIDLKILRLLQQSADLGVVQISEQVGLSHTPCWRRIQRLQQSGVIRERVAILDPAKVGLPVSVFAQITMLSHKKAALASFERAVQSEPEIVGCYSITGMSDYLIQVVVADVAAYERFLKERITQLPNVNQVHSTFALREIKNTSALPI
ncbi:MAG TPA: Lrp/AsnC family transcriptional regulator [Steroidobacter sp.]|uniref:Lrp/AsnC family transcriptional regulator n=1 Tax=Steroidobacter sp. TaxID=1978227 RepID=UPI002ED8F0AE